MYIDGSLRKLLWSHKGYIFTHPPKTAGTSVQAALRSSISHIQLERATISNLEYSPRLQLSLSETLHHLRRDLAEGKPWTMHIAHQSFADGWHRDLPPNSTVVIPYRSTRERLLSWIKYFGKVLQWIDGASFEITRDRRIRHYNPERKPPTYPDGSDWISEFQWEGDESGYGVFQRWIELKLYSPRMRDQLRLDLEMTVKMMIEERHFLYRDLFPRDYLRGKGFRKNAQVVDVSDLARFMMSELGIELPHHNSSKDFDATSLTGLDEKSTAEIVERVARLDSRTESKLLEKRWSE